MKQFESRRAIFVWHSLRWRRRQSPSLEEEAMPQTKRGSGIAYRLKSGTGRAKRPAKRKIVASHNAGKEKALSVLAEVGGAVASVVASVVRRQPSQAYSSHKPKESPVIGDDAVTSFGASRAGRTPPCHDLTEARSALRRITNSDVALAPTATNEFETSACASSINLTDIRMSECNETLRSVNSTHATTSPAAIDTLSPNLSTVTPLMSKYQQKQTREAIDIPGDPNAFSTTKGGKRRKTKAAAKQAQTREVRKSVDSLMQYDNPSKMLLVLKGTINHPKMSPYIKALGIVGTDEQEVALFNYRQQKEAFTVASATENPRGRPTDDRSSFMRAAAMSIAPNDDSTDVLSKSKRAKTLGDSMSRATKHRLLDKAAKSRDQVMKKVKEVFWSIGRSRKGYSKITAEIKAALWKWILEHPDVVESPIANDTIKVIDPVNGKKDKVVAKQLRMICVCQLHNDLLRPVEEGGFEYAYDEDGKVLISDTMLRALLPPEMREMTERYKQMCGCETCITGQNLLQSLKAYRVRVLRNLKKQAEEANDGPNKKEAAVKAAEDYEQAICHEITGETNPPTLQDAIKLVQCPDVEGFNHPKWSCVLRTCKCCPEYNDSIPEHEKQTEQDELTTISFDVYVSYTKCSKHGCLQHNAKTCTKCERKKRQNSKFKMGKIRTKKELTRKTTSIGEFHETWFEPAVEALAYHWPHVTMLGKRHCGKCRREAFTQKIRDVFRRRDNAERLKALFNWEIQSSHFGNNRDLSMEGSSIEFIPREAWQRYCDTGKLPDKKDVIMHFHSHLADDSMQDAFTTHAHMCVLVQELLDEGMLEKGATMWDDTDGCMKQYRSGSAMFLLSVLAHQYGITIDRAIGAPSHGKDVVDGLNATDKRFLKWLFQAIAKAESNDDQSERKMPAHSMTSEGEEFSLAKVAKEKLSHVSRLAGVKGNKKSAKREEKAKMRLQQYHVQKEEDVKYRGIKKVATGYGKGKHNGVMGHYNIHANSMLGVGCVAVCRIPCACVGCRAQLQMAWVPNVPFKQQPQYKASVTCKNREIFQELNDWKLITLVDADGSHLEMNDKVHEDILLAISKTLLGEVEIGGYGAVSTDDPEADGYYVLQWETKARQLDEDLEVSDDVVIEKDEWVVDGIYLNKVPRAKQWYTKAPANDEDGLRTTVQMKHVVSAKLDLSGESDTQKLPSGCLGNQARELGALRLSNDDHDMISDEIS